MYRIFVGHDVAVNVDNDDDANRLLASGYKEVGKNFIEESGLNGLERWISADTVDVQEGQIHFDLNKIKMIDLNEHRRTMARLIMQGYDAAVAASLTMPTTSPTEQDVTIGAAAFAAEDAEGLAYIMQTHAARRNELLAAVEAAETAEAVQAIVVNYAV